VLIGLSFSLMAAVLFELSFSLMADVLCKRRSGGSMCGPRKVLNYTGQNMEQKRIWLSIKHHINTP
jgi:hypothetical protein